MVVLRLQALNSATSSLTPFLTRASRSINVNVVALLLVFVVVDNKSNNLQTLHAMVAVKENEIKIAFKKSLLCTIFCKKALSMAPT